MGETLEVRGYKFVPSNGAPSLCPSEAGPLHEGFVGRVYLVSGENGVYEQTWWNGAVPSGQSAASSDLPDCSTDEEVESEAAGCSVAAPGLAPAAPATLALALLGLSALRRRRPRP